MTVAVTGRPKRIRKPATSLQIRKWNLVRRYGISIEEYDEFHVKQKGVCAVCGTDTPSEKVKRNGERFSFFVDHCHTTGRVRGLLCEHCNLAIGHIRDDPVIADRIANYLRLGD